MNPISAAQASGHFWQRAAARMHEHRKLVAVITLLVGAIPALYIGWFVARWGVEVPSMDDWEMAPLIAKAHTGELTFADLFEQQEEARTVVPKLIFVLSAIGGRWDVRDQMILSVVICAVTALGIYLMLRRSGLGPVGTAICFWGSVLLIFSPAQFELWLFASGFPSYMPVLCIVGGLLVLETSWPFAIRFSIAALLAAISTFTLAHGLLAWGLTFPVYAAASRMRAWKRWSTMWAAGAATCAAAYFYGYRKPPHLPDFAPAMSPGDYVQFLLAFLGGSFAYSADQQRVAMGVAVGAVALALFLGACVYAAMRFKDAELHRRVLPWLALGMYSIASGLLVTLGRGAFGLEYAISSRYVTFSLYLLVAVLALIAILGREILLRARATPLRAGIIALGVLLIAAGVHLYQTCFDNTMRIMHSVAARSRLARGAIVFSPTIDTSTVIKRINYPDPKTAFSRAARLDELGILRPRLVRSPRIATLPHREVDERAASGWCDAIVSLDDTMARASGWAALNASGRPADCVLLAYETPEREWVAFAMSDAVVRRRDIARMLRNDDQLWTGWTSTFRRDAVPPGAAISAWAVDIEGPRLYRLKQNAPELKL